MYEAYPLQWPTGYKRTKKFKHAQFKTYFAMGRDGIIHQLELMNAKNVIISSNVPLKRDGLPYAVPYGKSNSITDDTGIAVYFTFNNEQKVICCDAYHTLDDNMQAIHKTIEALRSIERWDCSDIINQTFTGFKALPEASEIVQKNIWDILELPGQPASADIIRYSYRRIARKAHPDAATGSHNAFAALQEAYRQALQIFNEKP